MIELIVCQTSVLFIEQEEQKKGSHTWGQQLRQWKATLEKDGYPSSNLPCPKKSLSKRGEPKAASSVLTSEVL